MGDWQQSSRHSYAPSIEYYFVNAYMPGFSEIQPMVHTLLEQRIAVDSKVGVNLRLESLSASLPEVETHSRI